MKRIISVGLLMTLLILVFSGCEREYNATGNKKFVIGGIGPISGGAAIYGQAVKNGAQIAVEEINNAGGINGYEIEFNFQDDENDPEKSVNAYNILKDNSVQVLMGTVTSIPCIAVADKTFKDNVFQITPSASSTDCVANDNTFQICFTDPNQGIASAEYIADNNLAKKVAVIYDSSDVYSSGIYEKFQDVATDKGLKIVSAQSFNSDSKTDFSVQLQKAKDAGAELVFLPIYYTEAALIFAQAEGMNYNPIFFGCDGLDGILSVSNFDISLAEDVMLLTPFAADSDEERTVSFVEEYKDRFGEVPNQFAADAYDAIYAIKAAIEKENLNPGDDTKDICNALKKAITEVEIDGLTGENMTWEKTGEVNKSPKAVIIKNGEYKLYTNNMEEK